MKLRKLPSSIPVYTWKGCKGYVRDSVKDSVLIESIVALCAVLVIYPAYLWYCVEYTVKCTWDVVRYCTHSLNESQEASVQRAIKIGGGKPMNITSIKPIIHGQSDKYSWNIYAYLKKNKGEHRIVWDQSDGKPLHPMNIYVTQGTYGTKLLNILWGTSSSPSPLYWTAQKASGMEDITDIFWESYVPEGRCAFHSHDEVWLQGGEHRFTMPNPDTKVCQWCGAVLRRTEEAVTKTVERWEVQ